MEKAIERQLKLLSSSFIDVEEAKIEILKEVAEELMTKKKDLSSNESTPRFCFTCGSKLEEIGLGWIQCKDEECGNVYLPFLDREGNQNLMLQETPIKLKSKI